MSTTMTKIDLTLAALTTGDDGQTISEATYSALETYAIRSANGGEVKAAAVAYAIGRHGIDGGDGAEARARLAKAMERDRTTISTWATSYGYIVGAGCVASAATFADARRAYNSTADARTMVEGRLQSIADAPAKDRPGMFRSLSKDAAAFKRDAAGKRGARPEGNAKGKPEGKPEADGVTVKATWLQVLQGLADGAPAGTAALSETDRETASALLAILQDALAESAAAAKPRAAGKSAK